MSKRDVISYSDYDSIPLCLDAFDISNILGIPRSDVYFLLHAEGFPTITIGGRMLVRKEKLFNWLELYKKTPLCPTVGDRHPQIKKQKDLSSQ